MSSDMDWFKFSIIYFPRAENIKITNKMVVGIDNISHVIIISKCKFIKKFGI